jgi:hypothetical protein
MIALVVLGTARNEVTVGVTPIPWQIRFAETTKTRYYGRDEENEDKEGLLDEFKMMSVSASESPYMYGCTTYEVVLPYKCFAWSDPVTGTKEWRDRVSVNIWLLSFDDILSVTTKVSNCQ